MKKLFILCMFSFWYFFILAKPSVLFKGFPTLESCNNTRLFFMQQNMFVTDCFFSKSENK